jgi:hypothetical protein
VKLLYRKLAWFCKGCGCLRYRATVPPDVDPKTYRPAGECGRCGSVQGVTEVEAA